MMASHSYLSINHLSSIIILLIAQRYSLRNITSSSGFIFSEILVNHSISEKKIDILFLSHSNFIFHESFNISLAISLEIYSQRALSIFFLSLFSVKYLEIFENVTDKINAKIICAGWFSITQILKSKR